MDVIGLLFYLGVKFLTAVCILGSLMFLLLLITSIIDLVRRRWAK